MKPICVKCQRFYRPKTNDIFFIEAMPTRQNAPSGTTWPELWKPYKLWNGDLWECHGCGHQIISGVGRQPIAEHYQLNFAENVATYKPEIQINDC